MGVVVVFAYGSLMYEPELPDAILDRRPARLEGWHRWFNKRSDGRGCPEGDAPPLPAVPGFARAGHRQSLVLGTKAGGHIDGLALVYPDQVESTLIRRLAQREGPSYRGARMTVLEGTRRLPAATFMTNPASDELVDLDLPTQAQILAAATPQRDVDGRARGADYLFGVLRELEQIGAWDPRMEALGELVRRIVDRSGASGYS